MDFLGKFKRQLALRSLVAVMLPVVLTLGVWFACDKVLGFEVLFTIVASGSVAVAASLISANYITLTAAKPLSKIEEIVSFAAHNSRAVEVPAVNDRLGKDFLDGLSRQIYNLASQGAIAPAAANTATSTAGGSQAVLDAIALPVIGVDNEMKVTFANRVGAEYLGLSLDNLLGKPLYDCLSLSFQTEDTFDVWFKQNKEAAVTATKSWERVRHEKDGKLKQFDLVASFSSGNSTGADTVITLFDRSTLYNLDDEEIGYVALAVHELRTPLTIMRGYIEVFEDELGDDLTPELKDFMHKMQASAQQLTAFVSNILNVARVEENQLSLKLRSEDLGLILDNAVDDLKLRAIVHGKNIELHIAEGLPPVAADRISIHEVINNLVDNAIKYSRDSEKIIITSKLGSDGLVETSVQDFGIGIPASVMGDLFQKFHRSHKSSLQISGTGLGLYLCKAMISAHGGNIWVRSKEGEGSTFTFTLVPYEQMSKERLTGDDGIIRGAHGWIKNHSLYRN